MRACVCVCACALPQTTGCPAEKATWQPLSIVLHWDPRFILGVSWCPLSKCAKHVKLSMIKAPPPDEGLTKARQKVQLAVAKQSKLPGLYHESTRNLQKKTPEAAKSAHVSPQHALLKWKEQQTKLWTTTSLLNISMWISERAMRLTATKPLATI